MIINLDGLPPRALQLISEFMTRMSSREVSSLNLTLDDMQRAGTMMTSECAMEIAKWLTAYQRVAVEAHAAYRST